MAKKADLTLRLGTESLCSYISALFGAPQVTTECMISPIGIFLGVQTCQFLWVGVTEVRFPLAPLRHWTFIAASCPVTHVKPFCAAPRSGHPIVS